MLLLWIPLLGMYLYTTRYNCSESLFNIAHFSFSFSIRRGREANQILRARFSSAVSTALEDVDIANKDLLSSIDRQYLILHARY